MKQLSLIAESLIGTGVRLVQRYPMLGCILRPVYRSLRRFYSSLRRVYRSLRRVYLSRSTKHSAAWVRLLREEPSQIRFFVSWRSSLKPARNALIDEVPWVTFGARKWLESFLAPDMNVFEFSSGGSTIFLARRVKTLISVEHDEKWHKLTAQALTRHNILNCQYLLVPPQHAAQNSHEPNDPHGFVSSRYPDMSFEEYVKTISAFPDESFDLVSVDGRARTSCILHALDKVRCGGYLMLDNSERRRYHAGKDLLFDWEQKHFFGPGPYREKFWQTSIYRKRGRPAISKGMTD